MNNLLKTLTAGHIQAQNPDYDLRLLLNSVNQARRSGDKRNDEIADPFYAALEGLLYDLRTVTSDNQDAEPFLRPVSKVEAPDYYNIIQHPMDLQTMLKKAKSKNYKSKREFKDDLDLIWSNCATYNVATHPIRTKSERLKMKAELLLKNITDRKERTEPKIPSEFGLRLNGHAATNGHAHVRSHSGTPKLLKPSASSSKVSSVTVPFSDTPALIRTPGGMASFYQLERNEADYERLREYVPSFNVDEDVSMEYSPPSDDKRKRSTSPSLRPRKRTKLSDRPTPLPGSTDPSQLWWQASQMDNFLANGLPHLPCASSRSHSKAKRPKKKVPEPIDTNNPNSLLSLMNNNIRTIRRMRHTHLKFTTLAASNGGNDDGEGGEVLTLLPQPSAGVTIGTADDDALVDKVSDQPWISRMAKKRGGVELGEKNGTDCLEWMSGKVLEHAGFQGTSKIALDVIAGVAADYLMNVGRTMRYLSDKHGQDMTPEAIILHTLFESGISKVQELESYITDDVQRYGSRLGDLEKKLVGAYRENLNAAGDEEEGLFEEEEEGETSAFAMGSIADATGDDFFGFRELGIADELGLSDIVIPRSLLKKKKPKVQTAINPAAPPPPFPPPSPFIPLTTESIEDQIGLLQPFYTARLVQLYPPPLPPAPPGPTITPMPPAPQGVLPTMAPPDPVLPAQSVIPQPLPPPTLRSFASDAVLPDDTPSSANIKMGPLGQIIKPNPTAKAKTATKTTDGVPKKKKVNGTGTGVGSGNGKKKKEGQSQQQSQQASTIMPPVVAASA